MNKSDWSFSGCSAAVSSPSSVIGHSDRSFPLASSPLVPFSASVGALTTRHSAGVMNSYDLGSLAASSASHNTMILFLVRGSCGILSQIDVAETVGSRPGLCRSGKCSTTMPNEPFGAGL